MRVFVVFFLVLSLAGAGLAQAGQYVSAEIGPYFPSESGLDADFNIEVAYGRDLTDILTGLEGHPFFRNVAAEVGIGYYEAEFSETIPLPFLLAELQGEVDVIPVTLSGIYTFPFEGTPFSAYGGAGMGFYFAEWGGDYEMEFGLNLAGGGKYALTDELALTGELELDFVSGDVGGVFLNFGAQYRF